MLSYVPFCYRISPGISTPHESFHEDAENDDIVKNQGQTDGYSRIHNVVPE